MFRTSKQIKFLGYILYYFKKKIRCSLLTSRANLINEIIKKLSINLFKK